MSNPYGVTLDPAAAIAESVPETVIAAVLLLHERSADEIVAKLVPGELEQVIKLVGRSPSCYPHGTLDDLKVASISTSRVASGRPAARIKPGAEHMRRARLARLRVHATQSAPEGSVPKLIDDAPNPIAFEVGRGPKLAGVVVTVKGRGAFG